MNPNITNILEADEKVVWQGVVNRKILATSFVISLVIIFTVGGFLFSKETIGYTSDGQPKQISGAIVGLAIMALGTLLSTFSFLSDFVKNYAITEKRAIIKSGIIGIDFKSIYFDQIKDILIEVSVIERIFKVGSIKIDTGKTRTYSTGGAGRTHNNFGTTGAIETKTMYDTMKHVENPYEAYKNLQSALESRKESLYSGRADRESHPENNELKQV